MERWEACKVYVWGGVPETVWEELRMAQTWAQKASKYTGWVRVDPKIMLCETVSFFFPHCIQTTTSRGWMRGHTSPGKVLYGPKKGLRFTLPSSP